MQRDEAGQSPDAPLGAEDWIAAVSHDLRDPMNAILGMTRLLLETALDDEQRAFAETIEDAAQGMLTLVNDLLDMSRLAHGDISVRTEPFELRRLVERSLDVVRPRLDAETVRLEVDVAATVPDWVDGDPGRLRQILVNLLANALKFTAVGVVRLEVVPVGAQRLCFTVSDSGPGVSADVRERIFEPFVRAPGAAAGGLGLGLAIVRRVVERLGGEITLAADATPGATFHVVLPLPATTPAPPPEPVPVAGRSLWLVAPPTPLRTTLTERLAALGPSVTVIDDAPQARRRLAATTPAVDAVLVTAARPDAESEALLAACRARWPEVVFLALAASGLRGEAETWRAAGFDGYLAETSAASLLADTLGWLFGTAAKDRPFVTAHSLAERAGPRLNVLVVDDNPMNLRLTQILLERAGHGVVVATSGAAALRELQAGGIDAVLMDVQMPGMDGLEATRRLRAMPAPLGRTPVLALTANASPRELDACRHAGMNDVLTKPVDRTTLLSAVTAAVRKAAVT